MSGLQERLLGAASGPAEPTLTPVMIEASPEGSDDTARLLGIAMFNGLCRILTALADRGLLCADELRGIEDAMNTPLDDPEWRDDELIAALRATVVDVTARALAREIDPPAPFGTA